MVSGVTVVTISQPGDAGAQRSGGSMTQGVTLSSHSNDSGLGHRFGRRAALTAAMLALSTLGTTVAAGSAAAQGSTNGQSVLGTSAEPYVCTESGCPNPWSNDPYVVQRRPDNTPPTNQPYVIANVVTGQVIDDPDFSSSPGTQPLQWGENDGENQKWEAIPSSGANAGYDTIVNRSSGLCLDVSGASTADGAAVIQWTCSGNDNQQWKISLTPSGAVPGGFIYEFTNKNSGQRLAPADGTPGAGLVQTSSPNALFDWYGKKASYSFVTTPAFTNSAPLYSGGSPVRDTNGNQEFSAGGSDYLIYTCLSGDHFRMSSDTYYNSSASVSQGALSLVGHYNQLSTEPWESQAPNEAAFADSTNPMTATDAIVQHGNEIDGVSYSGNDGYLQHSAGIGQGLQAVLTCDPN